MSNPNTSEKSLEVFRSQFETTAKNPSEWLRYGVFMKRGADVIAREWKATRHEVKNRQGESALRGDFGLAACYYLLAGLAIENLAKGILFAKEPERIQDGKIRWKLSGHGPITNPHDLLNILKVGKIRIHPMDEPLLEILSKTISWVGRYPTAINSARMGDALHKWRNAVDRDQSEIDALYARLHDKLTQVCAKYKDEHIATEEQANKG